MTIKMNGDASNSTEVENHCLSQTFVILSQKIIWNTAFKEITILERHLHRQLNDLMGKQRKYMGMVNKLLDSILSSECELDFSLYKEIERKYNGVEQELKQFKEKLANASEYVAKGRIEWLDGVPLSQLKFINLPEQERKVILRRSKQGNRVTAKGRSLLNQLVADWFITDLEVRFKDCFRRLEALLQRGKPTRCSSALNASKRRATKALKKRALRTTRKF